VGSGIPAWSSWLGALLKRWPGLCKGLQTKCVPFGDQYSDFPLVHQPSFKEGCLYAEIDTKDWEAMLSMCWGGWWEPERSFGARRPSDYPCLYWSPSPGNWPALGASQHDLAQACIMLWPEDRKVGRREKPIWQQTPPAGSRALSSVVRVTLAKPPSSPFLLSSAINKG
jgi:hypothetical protein